MSGLDFSTVIASTVHDMKNSLAMLGQAHARAAASQVHAKHAHAVRVQFLSAPLHVTRLVRTTEAVHKQCDGIVWLPLLRAVVMHDQHIAVGECDAMLHRRVGNRLVEKIAAEDCLQMPTAHPGVRLEGRKVNIHFQLFHNQLAGLRDRP